MKERFINVTVTVVVSVLLVVVGYYFGYKNAVAQKGIESSGEKVKSSSESSIEVESLKKDLKVYYFEVGEERSCPKGFPVKGKFESDINLYYTKENQFYERVKPHVCFS
jgi:hypothetical protein